MKKPISRRVFRAYDAKNGTEATFTVEDTFLHFIKREKEFKPLPPAVERKCPHCHQWYMPRKLRVAKRHTTEQSFTSQLKQQIIETHAERVRMLETLRKHETAKRRDRESTVMGERV